MRIHLHVPAYRLDKDMPRCELVLEKFPLAPVEGMQVYVGIGDGTPEAPFSTELVEITKVRCSPCGYRLTKRGPEPNEDAYDIECETSWVHRPGRRNG